MSLSSKPFPSLLARLSHRIVGRVCQRLNKIIISVDSVPSSESTVTGQDDASVYRKTEQVVGSIQAKNSTTSLTFPTSPTHSPAPCQKNSPPNTEQESKGTHYFSKTLFMDVKHGSCIVTLWGVGQADDHQVYTYII